MEWNSLTFVATRMCLKMRLCEGTRIEKVKWKRAETKRGADRRQQTNGYNFHVVTCECEGASRSSRDISVHNNSNGMWMPRHTTRMGVEWWMDAVCVTSTSTVQNVRTLNKSDNLISHSVRVHSWYNACVCENCCFYFLLHLSPVRLRSLLELVGLTRVSSN